LLLGGLEGEGEAALPCKDRTDHSFSFPIVKPAGGNEKNSSDGRTWTKDTEKLQAVTMGTLPLQTPST